MTTELSLNFKLWPKQLLAMNSYASEQLYGGAAGPGKSHYVRVGFITWAIEIPGLRLGLFRRKYADVINTHMKGPTGFRAMLAGAVRAGFVQIAKTEIRFRNGPEGTFDGGSEINLHHCQYEDDVFDYKSYEWGVLCLEEVTEFTRFQIQFLRARCRIPDTLKIPDKYIMPQEFWLEPERPRYSFPKVIYPTNPGGPGHDYMKTNFVDAAEPLTIFQAPVEDGGMVRQFIPGLLTDNPSVDPMEYALKLQGLPPAYRDALLYGKWDAPVGAFYPEYNHEVHCLTDSEIPSHWFRFRTFDWGSNEPFAVHWWAVSPGETLPHVVQGHLTRRFIPRGALVCYNEWYGCKPEDGSKGIGLPNKEIAEGILARSEPNHRKLITLADSYPFADRGGWTISKVFADNGVILTRADDSRVQGWSQLRDRLTGITLEPGGPRFPLMYFMQSCKYIRKYIPMLRHHPSTTKPKDAEEHGEATHCCDSGRYAATAKQVIKDAKLPMNEKVQQEARERPTVNKLLKGFGHGYFDR